MLDRYRRLGRLKLAHIPQKDEMGQTTTLPVFAPALSKSIINETVISPARPHLNYVFADNVRFLSMAAVVWIHAITFETVTGTNLNSHMMWLFLQPCKFGTIAFFLISGFLMGESLTRVAPLAYLKRRLKTVALPWLAWFGFFCALWILRDASTTHFQGLPFLSILQMICKRVVDRLFATAYWFVPNLLVSLCIILLFRRFLFDIRFGCALLPLSLFYGVNIYTHWIVTRHTEAILGFVFYLWLGAYCWRHYRDLNSWIRKIPITALVIASGLLVLLGLFEAWGLERLGSADSMNSLRISNQAFSICAVLTIVRIRSIAIPSVLNVRAATFGIYLLHPIILSILKFFVLPAQNLLTKGRLARAGVGSCALWLSGFVLTYGISLAISHVIASQPQCAWLVGRRTPASRNG